MQQHDIVAAALTSNRIKQICHQTLSKSDIRYGFIAGSSASSGDFVERSNISRQNIRIWIPIDPGLLLETNSKRHLKMDDWKMNFLLGWPIFRCFCC